MTRGPGTWVNNYRAVELDVHHQERHQAMTKENVSRGYDAPVERSQFT